MNGNTEDRQDKLGRQNELGNRGGSMGDRSPRERIPVDNPQPPHSFYADNRQSMTVRGVTDVLSFDETGVFLVTTCGRLNLEGTGLHVTVLNTKDGIVEVTGNLCGLLYFDNDSHEGTDKHKGKRGVFGRLLS